MLIRKEDSEMNPINTTARERFEGLMFEGMKVMTAKRLIATVKCWDRGSVFVRYTGYKADETGYKIDEYCWDEFSDLFGESLEEARHEEK